MMDIQVFPFYESLDHILGPCLTTNCIWNEKGRGGNVK